ncbi:protein disulfide-isomerase precursor [Kickxella alabastrina]|uniref:Protein disulfide-isomerase n=1 Tax=Kickxella alabastrina TaxID=61397 RepID=A0ACC1HVX5_9FUNG|nr:protein disulfide-isomerase precursor [Kickxella alabastrina]
MDATANDIPSGDPALQIQGFPTIVLIRGEDNAIVEYHGNRSIESLIEFVEENTAEKITYNKDDLKDKDDEDLDEEEDDIEEEEEVAKKADTKKADTEAHEEIDIEGEVEAEAGIDAEFDVHVEAEAEKVVSVPVAEIDHDEL